MSRARPTDTEQPGTRRAGNALRALSLRLMDHGVSGVRALHAALGLYLTVALAVSVLALWGFAELADEVLQGDTDAFDRSVLAWIHAHGTGWLDSSAIEVTALGSSIVLAVIGLMVSFLLWHLGKRLHVAMIWLACTGSLVLNQTLKAAFGRARPDVFEWLVDVGHLSFPSGHAMNSMVFYTVTAYAIGHVVGPGPARRAIYAIAAVLIGVIGWTRMYLGVHFPSDVIAGYTVGYAWATLCAVLTEAWGRRVEKK